MSKIDPKFIRSSRDNPLYTVAGDGLNVDAFSRQRVSTVKTVFNAYFVEDRKNFLFDDITSGTGAVNYNTNNTSMEVECTSGVGSAVRQTKEYFHYISGVSPIVEIAARFGAAQANAVQRIGLFDENNGLFFELDGTSLSVVIRSNASGAVVENRITQANWNGDKLDGTGVSEKTLDVAKSQIFFIDYQWLSVGRVRFCFVINGEVILAHEFNHANIVDDKYMNTGSLPLRCEVTHSGATGATTKLCLFCLTYLIEGEFDGATSIRSASRENNQYGIVVNEYRPVVSLRIKAGVKGVVIPKTLSFLVRTADPVIVELRKNATISNGTNWVDIPNSICQKDISANDVSGGTVLLTKYVYNNSNLEVDLSDIREKLTGSVNDDETLHLVARSLNNNADCYGAINFEELY